MWVGGWRLLDLTMYENYSVVIAEESAIVLTRGNRCNAARSPLDEFFSA